MLDYYIDTIDEQNKRIANLEAENKRLKEAASDKSGACEWKYDEEVYYSSCGEAFFFDNGTPKENGFKFCPYCGRGIDQLTEAE